MSYILGINAYHGDSSAAIIKDGKLIAAVEEERFNRKKHWSGFPKRSIMFCLEKANIHINDLSCICINRNNRANLLKKIKFVFKQKPSISSLIDKLLNKYKMMSLKKDFLREFGLSKLTPEIINIEHHRAHLASSFFISPFKKAALLSIDGFGDFLSCMMAIGDGEKIKVLDKVEYPHSLGLFYTAITQLLGFYSYGAEYKVMGLAPYGKPVYLDKMYEVVKNKDGKFELNLDFFQHHMGKTKMTWNNTVPEIGKIYTDKLEELLGFTRQSKEEITQKHKDIAASVQAMYEEVFFGILNQLYKKTSIDELCLAGGCAMNSVANGKIFSKTPFKKIYIQPAAGDAGGAIGAAYYHWNSVLKKYRDFKMRNAYWGPEYASKDIEQTLKKNTKSLKQQNCSVVKKQNRDDLCLETAELLDKGKVVGWFQGRMEWGPRALGNRSILCDPRRDDAKQLLNEKIKMRESFRPFAPSILREYVKDWFEIECDVPFMLQVYPVIEEKRKLVSAVTHVNGSGRLQTLTKDTNSLYYYLIKAFYDRTGVPLLLNTSFNENEPIVCNPQEALDCFLRTKMDVLVLGNFIIKRNCL